MAELSVQKANLANHVEEQGEDAKINDEQILDDARQYEHNRLANMMSRTKLDIKTRKSTIENMLKEDHDLLTDTEKRNNDVKIKSQLRTLAEQVTMYKEYNKDMIKICLMMTLKCIMLDCLKFSSRTMR